MKNTVLIFGGGSDERLVSVASAQNLASHFDFAELWFIHPDGPVSRTTKNELQGHERAFELAFRPSEEPFARSLKETIAKLKDGMIAFVGLHGTEGEDGTIQAMFEQEGIAFTGSGAESSRLCFDKLRAKEILALAGAPVAPEVRFETRESMETTLKVLTDFLGKHGKIILKPVANGSSVGLYVVENRERLKSALEKIFASARGSYMAESFVGGRELTVGVLQGASGLEALPPSEVVVSAGHAFDYEGKYLGLGSTEITPAKLVITDTDAAKALAIQAHELLGCFGYTRTDMILSSSGLIFLETNTLPGVTKASFVPQQLAAKGIQMRSFIEAQLALAQARKA